MSGTQRVTQRPAWGREDVGSLRQLFQKGLLANQKLQTATSNKAHRSQPANGHNGGSDGEPQDVGAAGSVTSTGGRPESQLEGAGAVDQEGHACWWSLNEEGEVGLSIIEY